MFGECPNEECYSIIIWFLNGVRAWGIVSPPWSLARLTSQQCLSPQRVGGGADQFVAIW